MLVATPYSGVSISNDAIIGASVVAGLFQLLQTLLGALLLDLLQMLHHLSPISLVTSPPFRQEILRVCLV